MSLLRRIGLGVAVIAATTIGIAVPASATTTQHEQHVVAPSTPSIVATVERAGRLTPQLTINCTTAAAAYSAQVTAYGVYYSWSQSTSCTSVIFMGNLSVLQSNGQTVSTGSDPMGQQTSVISSSGAFGPGGYGPYTMIYQVALSLPAGQGVWGSASSNCTGVGSVNLYCTDYTTVDG
jgi:hypothetical protein